METNLIKIEEVSSIMSSFPEIVGKNNTSVQKCNQAGKALLDTIEGEGMNEALDQEAAEYLKKVSVTINKMGERRKPLTQIFDRIRSHFTSQEKMIDPKDSTTIPGMLTAKRNEYAKYKYEQEQKRRKEAERQANVEKERATYRQDLENGLLSYFNQYLTLKMSEIQGIFSGLTAENFSRESIGITVFTTDYPKAHFDKFVTEYATFYLSAETKKEIRQSVLQGKYEMYSAQFKATINQTRQDLIDRLPSKRKELAEQEQLRQQNAEAAAQAEEARRRREAEESAKRLAELKRLEEEAKQRNVQEAQKDSIGGLFGAAAATVAAPPTNAKVKEKIIVLHPNGYLEIFQMWWINEGQFMALEDLEKTMKKMVTCCEKLANSKDQEHIQSQYVRYENEVKAK